MSLHRTRGWETNCLWSIFSFLETVSPRTYQVQKVHVVNTQTHSFTGFPNPCAPRWRNQARAPWDPLVLCLKQSSLSIIRVKLDALNGPTPPRGRRRQRPPSPVPRRDCTTRSTLRRHRVPLPRARPCPAVVTPLPPCSWARVFVS